MESGHVESEQEAREKQRGAQKVWKEQERLQKAVAEQREQEKRRMAERLRQARGGRKAPTGRATPRRRREVKALEERREQEIKVEAQEGRESAVQAQWGKATREECVEGKEGETNQVHEEDDVGGEKPGGIVSTTDHTCGRREAADKRGEQPRGPRGKRARQNRQKKGSDGREGREKTATTLHIVFHFPTAMTHTATAPATAATAGQPQHDDHSAKHDHEGADLVQSGRQRDCASPLHPATGASLHTERVIAVLEEPALHLEFYQRDATDCMRLLWNVLVDVEGCQEAFTAVKALENKVQATIGLSFRSSSSEEVDHDALWLALLNETHQPTAKSVQESDCNEVDHRTSLQRALTPYGGTEKHIVTVGEDNGPDMYVEEGHDVEHVTAILKSPYRCEMYQRNACDEMRMKFAVRIVIAKDTMPASEAIDHGTVSHFMTLSHDELWRTMPSSFSRPADWRTQRGGMPSTKKIGDVLMSMRLIPKLGVERHLQVKETAQETTFQSVKGGVHRAACCVFAHGTVALRDSLS